MTVFVLDASAALAWALPSQRTQGTHQFFASTERETFLAPHIFDWEVGNALLGLRRRGLISTGALADVLQDLSSLAITRRPALTLDEIDDLMAIAGGAELSLFDTAYFSLAMREAAHLVSRDRRLLDVARRCGLSCVDLMEDAGI